jgi:hypothetical protein
LGAVIGTVSLASGYGAGGTPAVTATASAVTGQNAVNPGYGGSGGLSNGSASTAAGGSGANGLVQITEFSSH